MIKALKGARYMRTLKHELVNLRRRVDRFVSKGGKFSLPKTIKTRKDLHSVQSRLQLAQKAYRHEVALRAYGHVLPTRVRFNTAYVEKVKVTYAAVKSISQSMQTAKSQGIEIPRAFHPSSIRPTLQQAKRLESYIDTVMSFKGKRIKVPVIRSKEGLQRAKFKIQRVRRLHSQGIATDEQGHIKVWNFKHVKGRKPKERKVKEWVDDWEVFDKSFKDDKPEVKIKDAKKSGRVAEESIFVEDEKLYISKVFDIPDLQGVDYKDWYETRTSGDSFNDRRMQFMDRVLEYNRKQAEQGVHVSDRVKFAAPINERELEYFEGLQTQLEAGNIDMVMDMLDPKGLAKSPAMAINQYLQRRDGFHPRNKKGTGVYDKDNYNFNYTYTDHVEFENWLEYGFKSSVPELAELFYRIGPETPWLFRSLDFTFKDFYTSPESDQWVDEDSQVSAEHIVRKLNNIANGKMQTVKEEHRVIIRQFAEELKRRYPDA